MRGNFVFTSPDKMYGCSLANVCGLQTLNRHSLASKNHALLEEKEGSGEVRIQAMSVALYSVSQSCCSILSLNTLHHCFSCKNSLHGKQSHSTKL